LSGGRKEGKVTLWTLVAPLRGLPGWEEVKRVGDLLEEMDGRYRHRHLLQNRPRLERYTDLVWDTLQGVRGKSWTGWEEANAEQVDGGWDKSVTVSVLAAVALHGERTVYVLGYERTRTALGGCAPDLLPEVAARLGEIPEARAELEVLQRRLVERHPELEAALERARDLRQGPPPFVKAVKRGHLLFLFTPAFEATHTVLGRTLIPLARGLPYWEVEPEKKAKDLAGFLRRNSPLRVLPHGAVPALLRGEGDPREAARLVLLGRLGGL
jgi:hypothetical protein